ncbi:uncharacterized protein LOC131591687 [Poecile atricapillus]|uniref:uncharacterized protein LOC131591687 n=1 Tax=Poecile atricapillus TaxID=48891 RepID=UPI0027395618|nr:uncharacterized protein LOC131591687 [Poecile atricapillus]
MQPAGWDHWIPDGYSWHGGITKRDHRIPHGCPGRQNHCTEHSRSIPRMSSSPAPRAPPGPPQVSPGIHGTPALWTPEIPGQEGSAEQDSGHGAAQGQGMRGWGTGNSILRSREILLQPWETLPRSTGRRKSPAGKLHARCASGGFPIPGFPTGTREPGQELALLGAQAAGAGSGAALAAGKNNPRGRERWKEVRASIPAVEGSSMGTKPTGFVHLPREPKLRNARLELQRKARTAPSPGDPRGYCCPSPLLELPGLRPQRPQILGRDPSHRNAPADPTRHREQAGKTSPRIQPGCTSTWILQLPWNQPRERPKGSRCPAEL